MQVKTIEKQIKSKLDKWLETISDEKLRAEVKSNLLVSGGCISSMFLNEPVNDYDVYLMNIDTVKNVCKYYSVKYSEDIVILDGRKKENLVDEYNFNYQNGGEEMPIDRNNGYAISLRNLKPNQIKLHFNSLNGGLKVNEGLDESELNFTPLYFSPNAISLSNDLQIVLRFSGTPKEIHETFDFVHATNYFTYKDGLVRSLDAIESILTKQLKYQGSHYPVTSIIRSKKFVKRGFNISAGEMLKIMFQISQLNLSDPEVLEEQLIGVDVAYFDLLIKALRDKFEKDEDFEISTNYFNKLIDKIFNENSLDEL